jgi:hypothetical protein
MNLAPQDEKKERTLEWKSILREEIAQQGYELTQGAGNRDYLGYYDKNYGRLENVETAYIRFRKNIIKELGVKE